MNSPLKLSLKHKPGKQRFVLGGLLLGLVALSLFGRGVKPGSAAPSAVITVNGTADGVPANDGQCTLREAIMNANANNQSGSTDCAAGSGADTIGFNLPAGQQTNNLTSALPDITGSLTINGPGAASLIVRRDSINDFRIFHIPVGGLAIAISGLTIRDGRDVDHGGGILSYSALTLANCVVTNNRSFGGGGVALINADGTITGCTISGNIGDDHGGGIDYWNPDASHTLTLTNCTISGNTAGGGLGAGILHFSSSGGTLAVISSTIANNTTPSPTSIGGGISTGGISGVTTVLRNTIIANNTPPNLIINAEAVITSQGGNLTSDDGGGFLNQATDQIHREPLLAPLGDYGGPSQTHALLPGSPAINAGTGNAAPTTDQRGVGRVGAVDIGAFESRGFMLVASGGNNQLAQVGNVFATPLRAVVSGNFAEPVSGGAVVFSAPNSGASAAFAPNQVTIGANNQAVATATANSQAGGYPVTATANGGNAADFTLTNVQCQTVSISPANLVLPPGMAGQPYSQTFARTGGAGAITWSVGVGGLPGGLTLNPVSGVLSGTPTVFGPFNISIMATDAAGCTGARAYALTINPPVCAVVVNAAALPDGALGAAYSTTVSASGGTASYTFAVSVGALPGGLSLSEVGALTGTPNAPGLFHFTIQATDATGCQGTRTYTVTINADAVNDGLQFYPLAAPVRLLDTRAGQTGCSAPGAPIPGGTSRTQAAGGFCSIPANARALTGNITTVQSGGGYLTLYPSDAAQPLVANSNYSPNEILNNVFTVGLGGSSGTFKIFVTSDTHVVVDVTGYYAPPAQDGLYFHPLPKPIRLLETRTGFTGCTAPGAPLQGGEDTPQSAHLTCDGVTIPNTAKAIVGNATTVNPHGPGFPYLTLFPADAARPLVASSNYLPGQIINAPFTVGLSATGEFKISPTTRTDLVIDVLGYYSADVADANGAGLLFNPLPKPVRLLETRAGFTGCFAPGSPLLAGSTRTLIARGVCEGVEIAPNALGIVGNATVVNRNGGYLTFWPTTSAQPTVATSNFNAGQVFNRHFTVGLGAGEGAFKIFTQFQTDLVIDVSGYFAP